MAKISRTINLNYVWTGIINLNSVIAGVGKVGPDYIK